MAQQTLAVPARRTGDFWIFWTGQTISQIGSALTATALPLLVFKLSGGSALDLGLASAATWVPYPLFGLFIGAWVDRVNRKGLMIGLDIAHAVVLCPREERAFSGRRAFPRKPPERAARPFVPRRDPGYP
jgi:hypothetical protein